MTRHHLRHAVPAEDIVDVAADICGLHAQLMSSAELSLWARVDGLGHADLDRALWDDQSLIKTWAVRGTLHLLPSHAFAGWQAALSVYRHYLRPSWPRWFGLTAGQLETLLDAVHRALDGPPLTHEQLASRVTELTTSAVLGEKVLGSWGALLKPAAFRGDLCFAQNAGQNVRFTRPDRWIPGWRKAAPDAGEPALVDVTRRYLAVYGPATHEDLSRWIGHPPAKAMSLIHSLAEEVASVDVEGTAAWMLKHTVAEARDSGPSGVVRLLPAFDPYVIGIPRQADSFLPPAFKGRVYRAQGWISPVIVADGAIAGTWRHDKNGDQVVVTIAPFASPPARIGRAIDGHAERLASFLGGRPQIRWEQPP